MLKFDYYYLLRNRIRNLPYGFEWRYPARWFNETRKEEPHMKHVWERLAKHTHVCAEEPEETKIEVFWIWHYVGTDVSGGFYSCTLETPTALFYQTVLLLVLTSQRRAMFVCTALLICHWRREILKNPDIFGRILVEVIWKILREDTNWIYLARFQWTWS